MTFVIVFLIESKVHVVVKDDWIEGFNSAKTKNNGRNCNQGFKMFWSATQGKPNKIELTNIDFKKGELKTVFEETCAEGYYMCYVLKCYGMYNFFLNTTLI